MVKRKEISKSVLKRLPGYLAYLKNMPEDAPAHISATALAGALGMGEVQVRKDLALVSDGGRPKIGYLRSALVEDIESFLGYDNTTDAIIVGAGKLGCAVSRISDSYIAVACGEDNAAETLKNALLSGISSTGRQCFDCGNASLPVLLHSAGLLNCDIDFFLSSFFS